MSYGTRVVLRQPFEDVVGAVRGALADQGFGVLTEIDVQATMKAKLDADLAPYLILGACNPPPATRPCSRSSTRWLTGSGPHWPR